MIVQATEGSHEIQFVQATEGLLDMMQAAEGLLEMVQAAEGLLEIAWAKTASTRVDARAMEGPLVSSTKRCSGKEQHHNGSYGDALCR